MTDLAWIAPTLAVLLASWKQWADTRALRRDAEAGRLRAAAAETRLHEEVSEVHTAVNSGRDSMLRTIEALKIEVARLDRAGATKTNDSDSPVTITHGVVTVQGEKPT